jgi:hypothetical protein
MKDINTKNQIESFDYESLWNDQQQKKDEKIIKELPKGSPRKGLKGKYIKKIGHVGRLKLKRSYNSYYSVIKEKEE